jgi:hypothetical protein
MDTSTPTEVALLLPRVSARGASACAARGGALTGEPAWSRALMGDGFPVVPISFITIGPATEPLRVSSSTSVGSGYRAAQLRNYVKRID